MGDVHEFEKLALPHLDVLYRAARSLCRDVDQAEDLVQSAVLKAIARFDRFDRRSGNCRAWLLRILRNDWIDRIRHERVAGPTVSLDHEPPGRDESEPTEGTDVRDLLESFSDEQVISALMDLGDDQRLTLLLADVEQLDLREVAEILEVAVGTVKSRVSRARAALKSRLADYARLMGFVGRRQR